MCDVALELRSRPFFQAHASVPVAEDLSVISSAARPCVGRVSIGRLAGWVNRTHANSMQTEHST